MMDRVLRLTAIGLAVSMLGGCAAETGVDGIDGLTNALPARLEAPLPSSPMPSAVAQAEPPSGFLSFCIRYPEQCAQPNDPRVTIVLTPANWQLLNEVNNRVNQSIVPEDDMAHYGRAEYWTIPKDGRGVCHDYAVTKRQALIDAGLPELALRVAVVLTPEGERHAVLTVATENGDYVLDNLHRTIKPWTSTGYTWLERQASDNPWTWVGFGNNADLNVALVTTSTR